VSVLADDEARRLILAARLSPMLQPLAERGVVRRYRRGARLLQEDEPGDTLLIVIDGQVRAFSEAPPDGRGRDKGREITFGVYATGDYVGEMALDGKPRSASVEALVPTVCSIVTRQSIRSHITEYPDFAFELLARVIARARHATDNARDMALNDVYTRLRALLQGLVGPADRSGIRKVDARPTHRDMASRLGCSREMVSRLLKDLEKGGYLETEGRGLRLLRQLPPRW
jgi:CRP/FNR family transcriptional regulator, cyclic AMP receptor protein